MKLGMEKSGTRDNEMQDYVKSGREPTKTWNGI